MKTEQNPNWLNIHCPECGEQKIRQCETDLQDYTCDGCGTGFTRDLKKVVKHKTPIVVEAIETKIHRPLN